MSGTEPPVVARMQAIVRRWEETADPRAIFLNCYAMMTRNMLASIERGEFRDPAWVDVLLHRFADYYFIALDAYEHDGASTPSRGRSAPAVWRVAHDQTQAGDVYALQKLLLGVNAHINYDLVLTLEDLLAPEWAGLTEEQRRRRYADHCHVNDVIAHTIDAVQDQVLEPEMPSMELVDRLMGRLDEWLISRLIANWRDAVWQRAMLILEASGTSEREGVLRQVEADALRHADAIIKVDWSTALGDLV